MSILIDQHIKSALEGSEAVMTATEGRLYPVVIANADRDKHIFPYVVYAHNGGTYSGTKDDIDELCNVEVEITICTKKHSELGQLAEKVRQALIEAVDNEYEGFNIEYQEIRFGSEDLDLVEGCYFIPLLVSIETSEKTINN